MEDLKMPILCVDDELLSGTVEKCIVPFFAKAMNLKREMQEVAVGATELCKMPRLTNAKVEEVANFSANEYQNEYFLANLSSNRGGKHIKKPNIKKLARRRKKLISPIVGNKDEVSLSISCVDSSTCFDSSTVVEDMAWVAGLN